MKVLSKIFLAVFVLLIVAVVGTYVFVHLKGQEVLTRVLNERLEREVTLGDVRLTFPLGVRIDDLNVKGLLKTRQARLQLGPLTLFGEKIHIASVSLMDPKIAVTRTEQGEIVLGEAAPPPAPAGESPGAEETAEASKGTGSGKVKVVIDSILVRNGEVRYVDRSADNPFAFTINAVDMRLRDLAFPEQDINTRFDLTGSLFGSPMNLTGSILAAQGWINWPRRNMDANLQVTDVDGQLALAADVVAEDNNAEVTGKIDISNFSDSGLFGEPEETKATDAESSLKDILFEGLRSSGVSIMLDFAFKTQMDSFRIRDVAFSGNVGYQQQRRSVMDDLKSIGKQFEAFGKRMKENVEKSPESGDNAVPVEEAPAVEQPESTE